MSLEEAVRFHKPADQHDITAVERLIYPVFSKKNPENKQHWENIRASLKSAMVHAGVSPFKINVFWWFVNRAITGGLRKGIPLIEVEAALRKFIRKVTNNEKDLKAMASNRAKSNFENIKHFLVGEKVLDLGAGDGRLALEIKEQLGKDVVLADVVDYNSTGLPLLLFNEGEKIPLADVAVDTTILYTVLHHSSDPEHLLKEATRVTKQRLVIKEAYVEKDDIKMVTNFVDWFYNRVIGDEDINVPLNYLTLKGWESILNSCGFRVVETKYVGTDEPIIPEHHVFIIAENEQLLNRA